MADELELLKKDWQKKEEHLPKLSYNELHQMIWKKSSSIVKWILIISILEFVLPHLLYLLPSMSSGWEVWESINLRNYMIVFSVLQYSVILYFIYQFYMRFKEISVLENTKSLMDKIIRTRRTVKWYVIFSLIMAFLIFVMMAIGIYITDDIGSFMNLVTEGEYKESVTQDKKWVLIGGTLGFGLIFTLIVGGVYFLLYGILLRKLNKNFGELKKLEI